MLHEPTPLIATIVAGIVLAFIFGTVAQRLRLSPLVGYLLAGVAVGPFTPGFVADAGLAAELAEIGVILLMFGVGLHFSLKDLLSVAHDRDARRDRADRGRHRCWASGLAWLLGWSLGGGHRVRPRALGRQHRGAAARACRSGACWRPSAATSPSAG